MITKELIEEYCEEFKMRYLTVKKYLSLSERDKHFHLFGHWNTLHNDEKYLYHSYLNGCTGEIEENYSKIDFSDLGKVLFVRWENIFILFKHHPKTGLKPVYLDPKVRTLQKPNKKHEFYYKNGITVVKEVLNLDMTTSRAYNYYNAFTGEPIK